jgi:hypothetical protein
MKSGRSLIDLAQELQRQSEAKRDFLAPTTTLVLNPDQKLELNAESFTIAKHAHGQIAQRLGIPDRYYSKMLAEKPDLLATNVNTWFNHNPEKRLVRTLDGNVRAFLSDRYRRLDNDDLAQAVLPLLGEMGGAECIVSCEVTLNRLYIKALNPRLELEVKPGDVVQAGICITNSEIGLGALRVEPLIYRLVCSNGMISPDYSQKRYHVGKAIEGSEDAYELFSDATLQADDRAFWMKVQDTVRAAIDLTKFSQIVERMREATHQPITGHPGKAVEVAAKHLGLNQTETGGVLTHLIQGGDLSAYGLLNAITRTSQDLPDYDRATELERMGSQVLALPRSTWREIAMA